MGFIRQWSNPLSLAVIIITIVSSIVITSRALVTREEFLRGAEEIDDKIDRVAETTDAKIRSSQAAQEKYFEEYIKNAVTWAADRAARRAVREYVEFVRSGKLSPSDNE